MTWIISDLHIKHQRINIYEKSTDIFTSVEERDELIINNWNKVVKRNDSVIVLGDVFLTGESNRIAISRRLKGSKYVILGNHDSQGALEKAGFIVLSRKHQSYYLQGFELVHNPVDAKSKGLILHGHLHDLVIPDSRYMNLSCCLTNYTPVSLEQIKSEFQKRGY